jgi:hypothetical protein
VPSIRTHSMRRALSYCTPQDEEGVSTAWPCSEAHQTTRGVFRGCRIGCRWQRTSLLIRWRPNNGRSVTACSTKAAGATKRRTAQHTVRPGVLVTVLVVRTAVPQRYCTYDCHLSLLYKLASSTRYHTTTSIDVQPTRAPAPTAGRRPEGTRSLGPSRTWGLRLPSERADAAGSAASQLLSDDGRAAREICRC